MYFLRYVKIKQDNCDYCIISTPAFNMNSDANDLDLTSFLPVLFIPVP